MALELNDFPLHGSLAVHSVCLLSSRNLLRASGQYLFSTACGRFVCALAEIESMHAWCIVLTAFGGSSFGVLLGAIFFVSGFLRSKAHLLPQIQIVRAEAVPERKSGLGVC